MQKRRTDNLPELKIARSSERERDSQAEILRAEQGADTFDVFLCHNSADKGAVEAIAEQLRARGILPWLDEWELPPGKPWQPLLEKQIHKIHAAAVFVGESGIGPWQELEHQAFLREFVRRKCPVIPVILPSAPQRPRLPLFLRSMTWVDFRWPEPDPLSQLIWGITGERSASVPAPERPGRDLKEPPFSAERRPQRQVPSNLPQPLTSFIGREHEIAAVKERLATARLLALTGPGGIGKTRLALQVAGELLDAHPDGVWLVELAGLTDPVLVPQQVAQAVGVHEGPGRHLVDALTDALKPRTLLLLLDNCEHLAEACADFCHALLRACPDVHLLATSREVLAVPGESVFWVPPLSVPTLFPPVVEQLTQYEAVQLFIDRARLSRPAFAVTNRNAFALAAVCRQLDGIPLAIELAAARVRLLPLEQIAVRLKDRFRLLIGGSRTVPPHQQTLRATMDWSYDLLSEAERDLLRRLSVFAGGGTLEAAEAICAGGGIDVGDILTLLGQLVDKSLLQVDEQSEEARYEQLETIRQYGAEKLQVGEEVALLRTRHRDYYMALSERAEPELKGPEQGAWLDRLEREHDNMRVALTCAEESGETAVALRIVKAVWQLWWIRGYITEGRERLARILNLPGAQECLRERARALHGSAILACDQGDYETAHALHTESLAIRQELHDPRGIAASLNNLGHVARLRGEYETARALYEESLAIGRALGNARDIAFSLNGLGMVARYQSDYQEARTFYEESLAIGREQSDHGNVAILLNNLGLVTLDQGDYESARAYYQQSLALKKELRDKRGIAFSLNGLGLVALRQGEAIEAQSLFHESLTIRRALGDKRGIAFSLNGLGDAALREGDDTAALTFYEECLAIRSALGEKPGIADALQGLGEVAEHQGEIATALARYREVLALRRELGAREGIGLCLHRFARVARRSGWPDQATRLFGAAAALRDAIGAPLTPVEAVEAECHLAGARAALGEEAFAAAWAAGQAMPLEQAIAQALEEVPRNAETPG